MRPHEPGLPALDAKTVAPDVRKRFRFGAGPLTHSLAVVIPVAPDAVSARTLTPLATCTRVAPVPPSASGCPVVRVTVPAVTHEPALKLRLFVTRFVRASSSTRPISCASFARPHTSMLGTLAPNAE